MEPGEYEGFEWDPAKSDATLAERGIDFELASRVFERDHIEREDRRQDYGEPRYIVTGEAGDLTITLVWTPRSPKRRIISAWPASNRERRIYGEEIQRRD